MLSLPPQILVEQHIPSRALADPERELRQKLVQIAGDAWAGRRVAVALGSRGIDAYALMARTVIAWLREQGAEPFIMPAMGSHGGSVSRGQEEVLETANITARTMGVPIESAMDTTIIGEIDGGLPIHVSAVALQADAVVLVNRVKPHTDFESPTLGSGLRKMSAIGLGKALGAFACHLGATRLGYERVIIEASRLVVRTVPRLYGVALVEDGTHRLARIDVLRGDRFEAEEPALYTQARDWMARLPFPEIDVLIVDEIGKNISGTGMDTNVIGRTVHAAPMQTARTRARAIYVRNLTPESHGNAIGTGLADVVSQRLVDQIDSEITYTNALSAMTPAPPRVPMTFPTDERAIRAACRLAGVDSPAARIVRIKNTLGLRYLVASESYVEAIRKRDDVRVIGAPRPWPFAEDGNLDPAADLLARADAAVS